MVKFTRMFCVLALCLLGIATANAKVEQVHATFENPSNTNTTWTPDASGVTKGTFTWSTTYYNQLRNIGLPTGDITKYKKLVVDTEIKSGEQFRILIYKGGSNLTLYASNGVNEFILADTLKVLYPDTYNEFLLDCSEICLSGNNGAAPGEAIIKDVYLETYNDEGEKVYATFESPSNTNTTWTPDASGTTAGTFTWSTTYYNQLRNIGLPSGDISGYKKLVVDTEIKSGDQFRILIYKGGSNLTLYASNGVNEFILADTLKALYPDTYNEFLLDCTEICLSGNNNAAPGEAIIKSVYLETYPENEQVDIPDIVYEEDPGKPAGDFVDFKEVFPSLTPKLGLGEDGHPIVLGNGDVVVGMRSKNVVADLSPYTKLTMVTSPNLKLVLYMNHEIDAKQNANEYTEEDAGKYLFQDLQADENGLIEYDLTALDKQELNCICLPWDNSNKGTVWYILLTEKDGKTIYLNPAIWDVEDATERYAAYMFNDYGLNAWADFTAPATSRPEGAETAFEVTIPARYTGVVLCRMNGETTENNWENVWNQTEDIKAFDNEALFTITGWGEGEGAKSSYDVNSTEPIVESDIDITVAEGDIAAALAAATEGKEVRNITIRLNKEATYTVSAPLVAYKNLEIQANGATIDANELTGNFIEMATTEDPTVTVPVEFVSIHNATVKGLKKPLFYSPQKGYLINWLTIDNSIVEVADDVTSIDFTKGSAVRNFNIENSTVYAPVATTKSFYSSQAGQKLTELDEEGTQSFIIKNSTMYNLATGKNFFTHRQSNQKWLAYTVENSLFVNCGKSGQVIKGMNGGQSGANPTWTITGNAFNFEVDGVMTDTSAAEDTGDTTEGEGVQNSVAGVVTFTDAANGDFNGEFQLAEGATAPEALGDGRWAIIFKGGAEVETTYYLVGNMNEWTPAEGYKLTRNEEAAEGVEEYMISLDLAADAQFKVVKVEGENPWIWYPDGENNNYGQNGELTAGAAKYNVYFRPNGDGGSDWFYNVLYVVDATTDGINTVAATAQKAVIFNMNGQRVMRSAEGRLQGKNAQKGLYIVNGKKVVMK